MQKGHLILGIIVLVMMLILPAFGVRKNAAAEGSSALSSSESGESSDSFLVLESQSGRVTQYPAKEYLFGVLSREASPSWPQEALKAQTVAAYTLACQRRETRRQTRPAELKGADVSDSGASDQCFVPRAAALAEWGDKAGEYEQILDSAIESVLGRAVWYGESYAETVYHAVSGGRTESAENVWGKAVPYLVPVQSAGDLLAAEYCTSAAFSDEDFLARLNAVETDSGTGGLTISEDCVGKASCSESGTVLSVTLCGRSFTGSQLRAAFSLNSANFDITRSDGTVTFTVRGKGHLVGMSQNGAVEMARQGGTFTEILLWYYPGCTVS